MQVEHSDVSRCEAVVFGIDSWQKYRASIMEIEYATFGYNGYDEGSFMYYGTTPGSFFVALTLKERQTVVGYALNCEFYEHPEDPQYRYSPGENYMASIAIHPEHRGQGYLRILMECIEKTAREAGYQWLTMHAEKDGFAAKLERAYGDRIVEQYDHRCRVYGPQKYLKISLT